MLVLVAWQALGARGPINVSIMSDPAAFAHSASLLRPLPSGIADADVTLAIENHECESANLQIIRDDELVLPTCESLLPGITRGIVKSIARGGGGRERAQRLDFRVLQRGRGVYLRNCR